MPSKRAFYIHPPSLFPPLKGVSSKNSWPSARVRVARCHSRAFLRKANYWGQTLRCASNLERRTKYWYGPLSVVWQMLCKMAGHQCGKGTANITDGPEKPRSDSVTYRLTENALFDVVTRCTASKQHSCQATARSGVSIPAIAAGQNTGNPRCRP